METALKLQRKGSWDYHKSDEEESDQGLGEARQPEGHRQGHPWA